MTATAGLVPIVYSKTLEEIDTMSAMLATPSYSFMVLLPTFPLPRASSRNHQTNLTTTPPTIYRLLFVLLGGGIRR